MQRGSKRRQKQMLPCPGQHTPAHASPGLMIAQRATARACVVARPRSSLLKRVLTPSFTKLMPQQRFIVRQGTINYVYMRAYMCTCAYTYACVCVRKYTHTGECGSPVGFPVSQPCKRYPQTTGTHTHPTPTPGLFPPKVGNQSWRLIQKRLIVTLAGSSA